MSNFVELTVGLFLIFVARYIAKYTINPALAHGMAHAIGSLEVRFWYLFKQRELSHSEPKRKVGKLADICLWNPAFFGSKPEMAGASHASHSVLAVLASGVQAWAQVIKGGTIAWAQMGDPNASIPTPWNSDGFVQICAGTHCILQWKAVPATVCCQRLSYHPFPSLSFSVLMASLCL